VVPTDHHERERYSAFSNQFPCHSLTENKNFISRVLRKRIGVSTHNDKFNVTVTSFTWDLTTKVSLCSCMKKVVGTHKSKKVKLSCYRHTEAKGEKKYSSCPFFALGTRRGSVVSNTHRPRFTPENDPWYPLARRLCGPQSWYGHRNYRKDPLLLPVIEPRSSSL
jgi:hypothetical protein